MNTISGGTQYTLTLICRVASGLVLPSLLAPGRMPVYAAVLEWLLVRSCSSTDMGCKRNVPLPAGTIFSATGWRPRLPCMCFVSSHAHRRGSKISGWPCQKSGPSPHWIRRWSSCNSIEETSLGKYRRTLSVPTSNPESPRPLLCALTTIWHLLFEREDGNQSRESGNGEAAWRC